MVEVEIRTSDGALGRGAAPTGQSVGSHEAQALRDGDRSRFNGLGVRTALANVVDVIGPQLIGRSVTAQTELDHLMIEMDGTAEKSRLGGNAIYATSIAILRAAAAVADTTVYQLLRPDPLTQLPVPTFNMINGGRYGDIVQPFNEFIVAPFGFETVDESIEAGIAIFDHLGLFLEERVGRPPLVGRSYGYAAPSDDPFEVLGLLAAAVERAGHTGRVMYALDCASSEMYDRGSGTYLLHNQRVPGAELVDYAATLCAEFPLLFVEDLLDEDDWDGYRSLASRLPRTLVLGDDLIVTNVDRLEHARSIDAVDGFILKPNQVGTISEALATHEYGQGNGLLGIPSGRSGGVIDDVVMDLSVGLQVPFQKNGAPRSGERIEKLNFLLRAADDVPERRLAQVAPLLAQKR